MGLRASGGDSPMGRRALGLLRRVADVASLVGGYLAAILVFCLMLLVLLEIGLRNLVGRSTLMTEEFGGYSFVAVAFLGLVYTARVKGHVRVRLLLDHLPYATRYLLHFPITLLSIAVISVGVWRTAWTVWRNYESNVLSIGIFHTPLYLPQLVMFVGMVLFLIQLVSELIVSRLEWEKSERDSVK